MTLKTSLFNKAIFVSTLKRFKLAAIIYFVILFQNVLLPVITLGLMGEMYPLSLFSSVSIALVLPSVQSDILPLPRQWFPRYAPAL